MPHRNLLSEGSGVPHGLFMISHHRPCGRWCFARLIRQAETLELQLHSQPPSKRTALSPLKRSYFRFAALTLRCRTEPALQAAPVFRSAYWLPPRHPAFRRAGVPFGLLAVSAPSRLTACWRSVRLIGCAKRSNSSRFATYGKPKRRTPVASRPTASSNARPSGSLRSPSELHSPGGRTGSLHNPRPGKPTPKRCREARRLPDSRGGKGRVKLSPVSAPTQLFKLLRCSGRLIFRKAIWLFLQNARPPGSLRSPSELHLPGGRTQPLHNPRPGKPSPRGCRGGGRSRPRLG